MNTINETENDITDSVLDLNNTFKDYDDNKEQRNGETEHTEMEVNEPDTVCGASFD